MINDATSGIIAEKGSACEDELCLNRCNEASVIAKAMNLAPEILIEDVINREIMPLKGCVKPAPEFVAPAFKKTCRFGFTRPDLSFADESSIKDILKSYVFRANSDSCPECKKCNGITVSQQEMEDEKFMEKSGFYKQKNEEFLPHPNCKCKWIIKSQ